MKTVIGLGLVMASGVLVYGSATGRLAPMLAALFYPSALEPATAAKSTPLIPGLPSYLNPSNLGIPTPGGGILPNPFHT